VKINGIYRAAAHGQPDHPMIDFGSILAANAAN
jgi:hypothetical protein